MSVGQILRDARLAKNLTVADAATAIRIRESLVRDLEIDSFEACGGEVYGRGHQRAYAKFLNLEIDDQIFISPSAASEFENAAMKSGTMSTATMQTSALQPTTLKPIGSRPNWSVVLGAGSVLAFAMLAVIIVGNNEGVSTPTPVTAPAENSVDTESTPSPATEIDSTTDGDLTAATSANVEIGIKVTSDSCWLRVTDSAGAVVFQGVLRVGDDRSFSDPTQLSVVLGNAGGVNFTLNGVDLGTPGRLGEVLRVTLLPGETSITS
jgi:cytoskeletal protein RodZ